VFPRHLDPLDVGPKVKEGETTNDLYAFLTTEPNAEVGAIHPKAMPVILATPDEARSHKPHTELEQCPSELIGNFCWDRPASILGACLSGKEIK
jgi:hypothetical protein